MDETHFIGKTHDLLVNLLLHNLVRTRCSKEFREAVNKELERLADSLTT